MLPPTASTGHLDLLGEHHQQPRASAVDQLRFRQRGASDIAVIKWTSAASLRGDHLAVDYRLIGQGAKRPYDAWVFGVEILVVAGPQKDLAI